MPMKATTPKAKGSAPGGGGWRPLGCCWKRGIDGGGGERRLCAESEVTSDIARRVGGGPPEPLGEVGQGLAPWQVVRATGWWARRGGRSHERRLGVRGQLGLGLSNLIV